MDSFLATRPEEPHQLAPSRLRKPERGEPMRRSGAARTQLTRTAGRRHRSFTVYTGACLEELILMGSLTQAKGMNMVGTRHLQHVELTAQGPIHIQHHEPSVEGGRSKS